MEACRNDAVAAVNSYLRKVQGDPRMDARISVVLFDSQSIDTIRDRVSAAECAELTPDEYEPRGATPLLDAVGYCISIHDCVSPRDERRIMAIMTDGLENASREFNREQLRGLLDHKRKQDGWLILYLGSGHDSWTQASEIGIPAGHTADFSINALAETADVLHGVGSRFVAATPGRAANDAGRFTSAERGRLRGGQARN